MAEAQGQAAAPSAEEESGMGWFGSLLLILLGVGIGSFLIDFFKNKKASLSPDDDGDRDDVRTRNASSDTDSSQQQARQTASLHGKAVKDGDGLMVLNEEQNKDRPAVLVVAGNKNIDQQVEALAAGIIAPLKGVTTDEARNIAKAAVGERLAVKQS